MIARAVVHRPHVVFLDEPTTGLDPEARVAVWELINGLRAEGLAVVLTTHSMDEAERLSDRLRVLQAGKVRAAGQSREVLGDIVGEHVVWGEALWAATLATAYAAMVCGVLVGFGMAEKLTLHWGWLPFAIPLIFLAALSFSAIGPYFTAIIPSIDPMSLPFFLVIMPIGFASSTYFPLPDVPWLTTAAQLNPLHHLAEGLRTLLLHGQPTWHLASSTGLCLLRLAVLIPVDMRLLRKRVFGDG